MKKMSLLILFIPILFSCKKKDNNPLGKKIRPIEYTWWVETGKRAFYGIAGLTYIELNFDKNNEGSVLYEDSEDGSTVGIFDMTYNYDKSTGDLEIKFSDEHDSYIWTGSYVYGILFLDGQGYKKQE